MSSTSVLLGTTLLGVSLIALALSSTLRSKSIPGPPSIPLLGSLPWLGSANLADKAKEWTKRYGGLIQVDLGMRRALLVTTVNDARALLNGSDVEDRPRLMLNHDELDVGKVVGPLVPYNSWIATTRKISTQLHRRMRYNEASNPARVIRAWLDQEYESISDLGTVTRKFALLVSLEMGFGVQMDSVEDCEGLDELQQLNKSGLELLGQVDTSKEPTVAFPFLKHLMRKHVQQTKARGRAIRQRYEACALAMARKAQYLPRTAPSSQFDLAVDSEFKLSDEEAASQGSAIIMGSIDTIYWTLLIALSCVAYLREEQDKIQSELDAAARISGRGFSHHPAPTPRIVAFIRETMRLFPFNQIGFPRLSSAEIVHRGLLIPKGTMIVPFPAILGTDEAFYGSGADQLRPERYLDADGSLKPITFPAFGFGFGRRACPGYRLAEDGMASMIAEVLFHYDLAFVDHRSTLAETLGMDTSKGFSLHLPPVRISRRA